LDLQEVFVYLRYSKKQKDDLKIALDTKSRFDYWNKKLKFAQNLDEKQT